MASRSIKLSPHPNRNNLDSPSSTPSKPTLADWFLQDSKANMAEPSSGNGEGGIGSDEASSKASSISIPPLLLHPSRGDECFHSQAKSLPTSPIKTTSSSRSIEDLRAAITQMKECSIWQTMADKEGATKPTCSHPMELRDEEVYSHSSQGKIVSDISVSNRPSSGYDEMKKKMHAKLPESHVVDHPLHCPVNSGNCVQYPPQVNPSKPLFQNPLPHPVINPNQAFKPMDNYQVSPPKPSFSKFSHLAEDFDPFPPLKGPHLEQNVLTNPVIPSSPPSPKAPWSQLFTSNRVKANGTSLEHFPNQNPNDNPSIEITHEEVSAELERWQNALVGHVIGAKPPFKLMQKYVEIIHTCNWLKPRKKFESFSL